MIKKSFKTRETQPAKETPGNTVDAPALLAQVDGHFGQVDTRTKAHATSKQKISSTKMHLQRTLLSPDRDLAKKNRAPFINSDRGSLGTDIQAEETSQGYSSISKTHL